MTAEFRDKRYSGPALRIDLIDRGYETGLLNSRFMTAAVSTIAAAW